MHLRTHFSLHDGAILLGIVLLGGSLLGLLIDSMRPPVPDESEQRVVVQVVTPTAAAQAAAPQPSWTPFQPVPPTAPAPAAQITTAETATAEPIFLVPAPEVTATPQLPSLVPDRIVIPAINLDAPIYAASYSLIDLNGQIFQQWEAPPYAVGWQFTSAELGRPGNTVLNGHHNVNGSVFGRLVDLSEQDTILVYSGDTVFQYEVANKMILPEEWQDLSVRLENARWLQTSTDERLTLVTCWPANANSHRLIVVARPVK